MKQSSNGLLGRGQSLHCADEREEKCCSTSSGTASKKNTYNYNTYRGKGEDPIHIVLPLICIVIVGILLHIHSPKHPVTERNAKATERIQKLRKYAKPIK